MQNIASISIKSNKWIALSPTVLFALKGFVQPSRLGALLGSRRKAVTTTLTHGAPRSLLQKSGIRDSSVVAPASLPPQLGLCPLPQKGELGTMVKPPQEDMMHLGLETFH